MAGEPDSTQPAAAGRSNPGRRATVTGGGTEGDEPAPPFGRRPGAPLRSEDLAAATAADRRAVELDAEEARAQANAGFDSLRAEPVAPARPATPAREGRRRAGPEAPGQAASRVAPESLAPASRDRPAPRHYPTTITDVAVRLDRAWAYLFTWRETARRLLAAAVNAPNAPGAFALEARAAMVAGAHWGPTETARWLLGDESDDITDAERLAGSHFTEFTDALLTAGQYWPPPGTQEAQDRWLATSDHVDGMRRLSEALERAAQHAAILMLWRRVHDAFLGDRISISQELSRWALSDEDAATVKKWVDVAPPSFKRRVDDERPIRINFVRGFEESAIYRGPRSRWEWVWSTLTFVWGPLLGLGALYATFWLTERAAVSGIPTVHPADWSPGSPIWGLTALYACVIAGALLHLGSKLLSNVKFEDGIRIYAVSTKRDWLSLRWLGVLQVLIPITVVTGMLWVAGSRPTDVEGLGFALLAGFSADSIFRNSMARFSTTADASDAKRAAELQKLKDEAIKAQAAVLAKHQ